MKDPTGDDYVGGYGGMTSGGGVEWRYDPMTRNWYPSPESGGGGGGGVPFLGKFPTDVPSWTAAGNAAGGMSGFAGSELLKLLLKVAPMSAGLIGQLAGGGFGGGNTGPGGNIPPELSELLALSMQRMRDQEPLFQAVTKQALAGLPAYAKGT